MLQRLSLALVELKGNYTFENLLNEIHKIFYSKGNHQKSVSI